MANVESGAPVSPSDGPFSSRQERIARRLFTQIGPGPAAFFRDACSLVSGGSAWPSVTHLVGHLMREIESAVLWVLEPEHARGRDQAGGHKAKILAILTGLEISHDDLVAEYWLGFAGQSPRPRAGTPRRRENVLVTCGSVPAGVLAGLAGHWGLSACTVVVRCSGCAGRPAGAVM